MPSTASPQIHEIVESYFWGAIITPWALLGEASRRRAQGCKSSYIEEWGGLSLRAETHLIPDQSHSFEQSSVALINKNVGDSLTNVCLGYHQLIAWIAFEDDHQATGSSSWRGTHFETTEQNTTGHSHANYVFERKKVSSNITFSVFKDWKIPTKLFRKLKL